MPPWLSLVLRLVFTVALLAYALRGVDWSNFATLLLQADWWWWAAGMATALLVQAVAGVRWAALARPLGFDFPRRFFVWRFFEGMFFSLCLPSSIGGDVIKAYRVGDTTPRRLLAGCSVLADRLTGLSALAVLGGAALAARKYDLSLPVTLVVAAGLLAVALAVFLLAVSFLDRIVAWLPEGSRAGGFLSQLLPYQRQPSLIAKAVAWSFVVQAGGAVGVALSARALGVDQPLSLVFGGAAGGPRHGAPDQHRRLRHPRERDDVLAFRRGRTERPRRRRGSPLGSEHDHHRSRGRRALPPRSFTDVIHQAARGLSRRPPGRCAGR